MPSRIDTITIDCHDPRLVADFWMAALGYVEDPGLDDDDIEDDEAYLVDPGGVHPPLLFLTVPEAKTAKNRLHLDLTPDGPREAEVERLLGLGATLVDDHRKPDGSGWAVLADPEGNELCILRSDAEKGRPGPTDLGPRPFPPVRQVPERAMLDGLLDWYRDGVIAKVEGMDQRVAVATPLGSPTSVAGLVKHLALVEDGWFTEKFAGGDPQPWVAEVDWDADPDWEFHSATTEPLELQIERYREAIARSRAVAEGRDLDDLSVRHLTVPTNPGPFTLRFATTHLLEETARHLGHLDVLRELLDGTTGV